MFPAEFEPALSAIEQPQTHALDRATFLNAQLKKTPEGEQLQPISLWPLVQYKSASAVTGGRPRLRPLVTQPFPEGRRQLSIHRGQLWRRRSGLNLIVSTNFKSDTELTVLAVNCDHIQNIGRRKGSAIISASGPMKLIIAAILVISSTREITAVTFGQTYGQTSYQSVHMFTCSQVFVFSCFAWVEENSVEYTES